MAPIRRLRTRRAGSRGTSWSSASARILRGFSLVTRAGVTIAVPAGVLRRRFLLLLLGRRDAILPIDLLADQPASLVLSFPSSPSG